MIAAAGLFAPTIRHHDGMFYIACTNVGCEGSDFAASNFYIFSKDIKAADSWCLWAAQCEEDARSPAHRHGHPPGR